MARIALDDARAQHAFDRAIRTGHGIEGGDALVLDRERATEVRLGDSTCGARELECKVFELDDRDVGHDRSRVCAGRRVRTARLASARAAPALPPLPRAAPHRARTAAPPRRPWKPTREWPPPRTAAAAPTGRRATRRRCTVQRSRPTGPPRVRRRFP